MVELQKVQIRNFRRNKELDIEFDQITTLRGASSKGKSSALWSIKWAVFDRPLGKGVIHWNAKHSAVKLTFNDCAVTRKLSNKSNSYKLSEYENPFDAIGTEVPEPVRKAINLSTINFSNQHEDRKQEANFSPLFWFSLTAGEVNKELNKIVDLEIIDNTTANIARMQRESNTRIKILNENVLKYKKEKDQLSFIVSADKDLSKLEIKKKQIEEERKNLVELANLIGLVQKHRKTAVRLLETAREGEIILKKGKLYQVELEKYEKLVDLISKAKKYNKLRQYKIPNIKPLLEKRKQICEFIKSTNRLSELVSSAEEYKEVIINETKKVKEMRTEFSKLMAGKCPLCGK